MAHLYESPLWRRNPLLVFLLGINSSKEYQIISRAIRLSGNEVLLDLACGPGIYARRFARELSRGKVLGVDLSWPMLKHARSLVQKNGLTNLHLMQGDALTLPFRSGHFDVVNCAAALHLFRDPAGTFMEVNRVLKPGGQFTFSTFRYPRDPLMQIILRLRRNIAGIRSFRQKELESGLQSAGFADFRYLHVRGIWMVISAIKAR